MLFGQYYSGLGVGGWLVTIGTWTALLAVAVWAVNHLFPAVGAATQTHEPPDAGDSSNGAARHPARDADHPEPAWCQKNEQASAASTHRGSRLDVDPNAVAERPDVSGV